MAFSTVFTVFVSKMPFSLLTFKIFFKRQVYECSNIFGRVHTWYTFTSLYFHLFMFTFYPSVACTVIKKRGKFKPTEYFLRIQSFLYFLSSSDSNQLIDMKLYKTISNILNLSFINFQYICLVRVGDTYLIRRFFGFSKFGVAYTMLKEWKSVLHSYCTGIDNTQDGNCQKVNAERFEILPHYTYTDINWTFLPLFLKY